MATKKFYIGSLGPFTFDDAANVDDPDGDFAGETLKGVTTNSQIRIEQSPADAKEVLRLEDITSKIFPPVSVVDIDSPTELNSLVGEAGSVVVTYEVEAATDQSTLYVWEAANSGGESIPYVMSDGATGFWAAVAGKYTAVGGSLTASRLVATDGSKGLVSVADLASWIAGTGNQVTVTNDSDGTITLSIPSGAVITFANTGLHLLDTGGDHDLIIKPGTDVSTDRTLTLTTGDSDRTITLSGNPTLADWFDQAVKAASSPTFADVTDSGLTASRLMASSGAKLLTSVATLSSWLAGTSGQITMTDDGDGSGTLSIPDPLNVPGDAVFVGAGKGLVYGSCYGNEIAWTQAAAAQNTWYNISDADIADGLLNKVTHDGSGKLTVTEPGVYAGFYSIALESDTVNTHVESGIEVSGSGSAENQGRVHFEIANIAALADSQITLSSPLLLDLADNATVEVAVRTTDATTPDISVDHINIVLFLIGGT